MARRPPGGESRLIDRFAGDLAFLSNFWPSRVHYPAEGPGAAVYPTVEHAFQAAKTDDPAGRERIRVAPTPAAAKRIGRQVAMRPGWEQQRVGVMRDLLLQKFSAEPLRSQLVATGDAPLVEANTWHDQTWGDCRCRRHAATPGRNLLGELLMEVRARLR